MASSPAVQVPSTSIDQHGLSISTAPRSLTDPRPGSIYDHLNLAAALPVWFHPMTSPSLGGDNFLMLTSQRWYAANPLLTDPAYLSAYSVDASPNCALINAANGTVTAVNSGFALPIATPVASATLVGAASRGTNFLYTLLSTDAGAVVQQWHNNTAINVLVPVNEEIVPTGSSSADGTIVFDAGIQYDQGTDPSMLFYGIGATTSQVYLARKDWSRVGTTMTAGLAATGMTWEFFDGSGWVHDPTALAPVTTAAGPLLASGPLSFSHYGIARNAPGRSSAYGLMAVTQRTGSAFTAQVYSSLSGRPWTPLGAPIPLGQQGSTYLGGTAQLLGHLGANPALVDPATSATAIPYVVGTKQTSGSAHSLHLGWGLIQVPRHS